MSVFELAANVPKLKRVGLVKVINITDEAIHALVERASTLERLHLSYCDNLTVPAITYLLNKLPRLTHLSLTGVTSFRTAELQAFCRPAPKEFNDHQARAFCVFSGNGISELRRFLNLTSNTSDDGSTRRDSASSGESVPGPSRSVPSARGRLPSLLDPSISSAMGQAFASNGPNFLAPALVSAPPRRLQARDIDRYRASSSRNEPASSSMPALAPVLRSSDDSQIQQDRFPRHRFLAAATLPEPTRRPQGPRMPVEMSGAVHSRRASRQHTEELPNDQMISATLRNAEERDESAEDRARWMDAPAAYMGRMLRAAGLRRPRDLSASPRSDTADQGEGSLRRE
jgi:hypothetical protein